MSSDLEKWEARWSSAGHWAGDEPAAFLAEVAPFLPKGRALDLACGGGRNAVFLAQNGWHVLGIDHAATALEKAEELARTRGVRVAKAEPSIRPPDAAGSIELTCADLETFILPAHEFDLVVCMNFLLRRLAPALTRALRPGGMLVYETYTLEQLKFDGGPHNPEFLLRPGELRGLFSQLDVIFYREVSAGKGIASLLARKAIPERSGKADSSLRSE